MAVCGFIDIEYNPQSKKIDLFGFKSEESSLTTRSWHEISLLLDDSQIIAGHNIIQHDIEILKTKKLFQPSHETQYIDTLVIHTLLFHRNPYHSLKKEYLTDRAQKPNPLEDCIESSKLLDECIQVWVQLDQDMQGILYYLLKTDIAWKGFWTLLEYQGLWYAEDTFRPQLLVNTISQKLQGRFCKTADLNLMIQQSPGSLSYAFMQLFDETEEKQIPVWAQNIFKDYPEVQEQLLLTKCQDPSCSHCQTNLSSTRQLENYFGFKSFRPMNGDLPGQKPMQQRVVESALNGESLLAVFPTGGGKSITFQLPALIAGGIVNSLSVVISPLQSLMKDQVDNLNARGIENAAYINGLLTPLERASELQKIKTGEKNLLYISPESLRSESMFQLLLSRPIQRIIIDEAHCFSTWGHDFRVDYLYIAEFKRELEERKGLSRPIPVSCFTATAKVSVVEDIIHYFDTRCGLKLQQFVAKGGRTNLDFKVYDCSEEYSKVTKLREILNSTQEPVIIYCSTTKKVEELHKKLDTTGFNVGMFHGKMDTAEKQDEMDDFISGNKRIIVATSAFGMGVDKDNVQHVVHFEVSDSIENYVQEAGRAGRNPEMNAFCHVLFDEKDLETHFSLLNNSKLQLNEIKKIWDILRKTKGEKITISALELANQLGLQGIREAEADTKVRNAILILEELGFLQRKRNSINFFGDSLGVKNMEEVHVKLSTTQTPQDIKDTCIRIMNSLISESRTSQNGNLGNLMDSLGLTKETAFGAMSHLKDVGCIESQKDLSLHLMQNGKKTIQSIIRRLKVANSILVRYIDSHLSDKSIHLPLKRILHDSKAEGQDLNVEDLRLELDLWNRLKLAAVHRINDESKTYKVTLNQSIPELLKNRQKFFVRVEELNDYLKAITQHPKNTEKGDYAGIKVFFNLTALCKSMNIKHAEAEDLLLILHKLGAIQLKDGLFILYSALVLEKKESKKTYTKKDYETLERYYEGKSQQIHVVQQYAETMLSDPVEGQQLVEDYFTLDMEMFRMRYLSHIKTQLTITPKLHAKIQKGLNQQQLDVLKSRGKNILVAAGPGSGKTKLIVHKAATAILTEDVRPEQLLILCYNRSAADEVRRRLYDLTEGRSSRVKISTFHSFAFQILGKMGSIENSTQVIQNATQYLNEEADCFVNRYTKIFVDEYQDLGSDQYQFLVAIQNRANNPKMLVVGDDDQAIYGFIGASSLYMRKFEADYDAKKFSLITNYRSSPEIVHFSKHFFPYWSDRVKQGIESHSLVPKKGEVNQISFQHGNFYPAVLPLIEKSTNTAILSFYNESLSYIERELLENEIQYQFLSSSKDMNFKLKDLIEVWGFDHYLKLKNVDPSIPLSIEDFDSAFKNVKNWLPLSSNIKILDATIHQFTSSYPESEYFYETWFNFLSEVCLEDLQLNHNAITLSTFHKSKGREWDEVIVLLDKWRPKTEEDWRTLYVASTRAKYKLTFLVQGEFFPREHFQKVIQNTMKSPEPYEKYISFGLSDVVLEFGLGDDPKRSHVKTILGNLPAGVELEAYRDKNSIYLGITRSALISICENKSLEYLKPTILQGNRSRIAIIRLSKSKVIEINRALSQGFQLDKGIIEYIVRWHKLDTHIENNIALGKLRLMKEKPLLTLKNEFKKSNESGRLNILKSLVKKIINVNPSASYTTIRRIIFGTSSTQVRYLKPKYEVYAALEGLSCDRIMLKLAIQDVTGQNHFTPGESELMGQKSPK